jgi:hypothetical protein
MADIISVDDGRTMLGELGVTSTTAQVGELALHLGGEGDELVWERDGKQYPIVGQKVAHKMSKHCGVSSLALHEYQENEQLVSSMIRHSLHKPARRSNQVRIVHTKDEVVDIVDGEAPWVSPIEAFDLVANTVQNLIGLSKVGILTEEGAVRDHLEVEFLTDYREDPPKRKGDWSHAGLLLGWNSGIRVQPFVMTLACTNGLLHRESKQKIVRSRKEFEAMLTSAVKDGVLNAQVLAHKLVSLDEVEIENAEQALLQVSRQNRLADRIARNLAERAPELPEESTMYDVVNLITNHAGTLRRGTRQLQAVAGSVVEVYAQQHHCSRCGSPLTVK